MRTRLLESKEVVRSTVTKAEVIEVQASSVILRTIAVAAVKQALSSADSEMLNQKNLARIGDEVEGRVRIDVVSDDAIRVRYAEGVFVPDNLTPMVVGSPVPATRCDIDLQPHFEQTDLDKAPWLKKTGDPKATGQCFQISTANLRIVVSLDPYRIAIYGSDGRSICGVGGPEKDNFSNWDSYNTGVCRARDGHPIASESFDLHHDECVYGLGEKFIKLNKVGQTIDLDTMDALGVTTPRSYKNVPFYVTTGGYGVYFNHSSLMTYWVGSLSGPDIQVGIEDDFLDYTIITGNIKQILNRYTDITGKGSLPPQWSFGYWQSKISYKSADETLEIARKMRENEIPCDVIHLDTYWYKADWYCDLEFSKERFPDPEAYLRELSKLGIKVSLWQLPYIPEGSNLFNDLKAVDGFVKNEQGGIYDCHVCFTPDFRGVVGVVDYTNPAAIKVHQEYFRRLFRMGVKVIKTDFGEGAPIDGVYFDGTPGHRMHNLYPLLYNKAIFEVTREETGDGVVWARSAWAGNQRYPLHWGGDNSPNYFNLAPQLEGGLSFGLSGYQFWSHDIGGFCGTTNDHLLIRWMQLGMFISHSRIHGFGDRELYKFEPETVRICRDFLRLRYRLMPYIYGSSQKCVEQSLPMARALVVEFQDDPTVYNMGDEFLFGESILVAPIFDEGDTRRVYLPEGTWFNWWTHQPLMGRQWITATVDLEKIPLFIREGGLIPMGPVMNYIGEKPIESIDLLIAPFSMEGTTTLNVPVNGEWIPITYTAIGGKHTLQIGKSVVPFNLQVVGNSEAAITVHYGS